MAFFCRAKTGVKTLAEGYYIEKIVCLKEILLMYYFLLFFVRTC